MQQNTYSIRPTKPSKSISVRLLDSFVLLPSAKQIHQKKLNCFNRERDHQVTKSMVKLASAREIRLYGPRLTRRRSEYVNAGIYIFSTILLLTGFLAQFSGEPVSGLVLLLSGFTLIAAVNLHDLIAHLAGIDCRITLVEYDPQLAFVEFAVPLLQTLGSVLSFLGVLFLLIEEEKGYGDHGVERHAMNLLIAGPTLWLIGSIHNLCQIYERANGHLQILQDCVVVPFLMASLLFLVGGVINHRQQVTIRWISHGIRLLGLSWIWLGICGSVLLFIGGLANVVKVFHMHQEVDGLRLERLRGGAQDRLIQEREGQTPFMIQGHRRRLTTDHHMSDPFLSSSMTTTAYKDVI
ncbi:hypothetical protein Dimus_000173 [Dionaea muscipula]